MVAKVLHITVHVPYTLHQKYRTIPYIFKGKNTVHSHTVHPPVPVPYILLYLYRTYQKKILLYLYCTHTKKIDGIFKKLCLMSLKFIPAQLRILIFSEINKKYIFLTTLSYYNVCKLILFLFLEMGFHFFLTLTL